MAKLKDRRTAHRLVAEVLWDAFYKEWDGKPKWSCAPEVKAEVERIREAHFAAGTIKDDLPEDHPALEPGTLAKGGVGIV